MKAIQAPDGEYYISRIPHGASNKCGKREKKIFRNWFFIKWNEQGTRGHLSIPFVTFPKEFVGKKIRLKVEIIKDKK